MTLLTNTHIECDFDDGTEEFCEAHFEVTLNWGEYGDEDRIRRQLELRGWSIVMVGPTEKFICPLHKGGTG